MTNSLLDIKLVSLITRFRKILDTHERHLRSFNLHEVQLEGWLKGEFISFLDQCQEQGEIAYFNREEKVSSDKRKRIDFKLGLMADSEIQNVWLELKHWLIGYQRGVKYGASFYFGDPTSVGISSDAKKLIKVIDDGKYILILTTVNPGEVQWQNGITKFNRKFEGIHVESLIQPEDFPVHYFIGLLKVSDHAD